MPFYALPYHIGVWKGMEGHREGNGHKLEESQLMMFHMIEILTPHFSNLEVTKLDASGAIKLMEWCP